MEKKIKFFEHIPDHICINMLSSIINYYILFNLLNVILYLTLKISAFSKFEIITKKKIF